MLWIILIVIALFVLQAERLRRAGAEILRRDHAARVGGQISLSRFERRVQL